MAPSRVADQVAGAALEALLVVEQDAAVGGRGEQVRRARGHALPGGAARHASPSTTMCGALAPPGSRRWPCGPRTRPRPVRRRRPGRRGSLVRGAARCAHRNARSPRTASPQVAEPHVVAPGGPLAQRDAGPASGSGCHGEHPLDQVGRRVPGTCAARGRIARGRGRRAAACGRRARTTALERPPVARQAGGATVSPGASASAAARPAAMPRPDGEVHALQPDAGGEAHPRGVAGDEHAVGVQLGHMRRSRPRG